MNDWLTLTLKDRTQETPEIRAWLDAAADIVAEEVGRMERDLATYGVATIPAREPDGS